MTLFLPKLMQSMEHLFIYLFIYLHFWERDFLEVCISCENELWLSTWGLPKSYGGKKILERESHYGPGNPTDPVGFLNRYRFRCKIQCGIFDIKRMSPNTYVLRCKIYYCQKYPRWCRSILHQRLNRNAHIYKHLNTYIEI